MNPYTTAPTSTAALTEKLIKTLSTKNRIWILTGAGISASSGIPTYRDHSGVWQHSQPIQHDDFIKHEATRKRYWARSLAGFHYFSKAKPNPAHFAIAQIQRAGFVSELVTQNVDRLHSHAGARDVIDLHGRLDRVTCLECGVLFPRLDFQTLLENHNPDFDYAIKRVLPDGDAELEASLVSGLRIPQCPECSGVVMPDVVFFGGRTSVNKVQSCLDSLEISDCVLVCGSSLSVLSGFRFIQKASKMGLPLVAINKGVMRGQALFDLVIPGACEEILPQLADKLSFSQ